MYVVDNVSMQGFFRSTSKHRHKCQLSSYTLIKVNLSEPNINWTVYNTESEEKFESTYHIIGPTEDVDEDDIIIEHERKFCWIIRRYNDSHTCTRTTIFYDHAKLNSDMVVEVKKSLVKSVIVEIQSKFNYTINFRKYKKIHQQRLKSKLR
ncbi:hypothetical protein Ahy_A09g045689 isoform A [Arachis hypogaea]|uniref:Uncharacterized protein n=1 Tax=Arachis hypogaea TaxID=3818 RepID=A0A445BMZ9_ARAHY|nr:hypothetical protein Ahy_A09g045689 isoform A [Arachis hypogaea]